jgi:hypothetical protein
VDFIVLTPGGPDTNDDHFPPSHVDVTNSDGRSAYFLWKVGGTNAAQTWTWSHELGHQFGLKDEYYDPIVYPWHTEPADGNQSLWCLGTASTKVLKRHVQDIVDHAGFSTYLLRSDYTVQ